MLVQPLRKARHSIIDSMKKSCCWRVNVCTEAINEKWIRNERHRSHETQVQGDFARKSLIDTMKRNIRKKAYINDILSNMEKDGIWMVYSAFKNINKLYIMVYQSQKKCVKNIKSNYNFKDSQHNITCCFSVSKPTTMAINQRVLI